MIFSIGLQNFIFNYTKLTIINPQINNIGLLNESQKNYVLAHCKGMASYGWKIVNISWYSNGDKCMIVEDINGTVYPSEIIPETL